MSYFKDGIVEQFNVCLECSEEFETSIPEEAFCDKHKYLGRCREATYRERQESWSDEWKYEKGYCQGCEKTRKITTDTYDGDRDYLCYKCYMSVGFVYYNDCKGCENCYREGEE